MKIPVLFEVTEAAGAVISYVKVVPTPVPAALATVTVLVVREAGLQ